MTSEPIDLMLGLVPAAVRPALAALFALDKRLGGIIVSTSDPIIGQLRLAWWRDALGKLDDGPAPAEPLLRDVSGHLVNAGVRGVELAEMATGWETILIADPTDRDALNTYAEQRGERLFGLAGRLLGGGGSAVMTAGKVWALADLPRWAPRAAIAELAASESMSAMDDAYADRWPTEVRPLGILALMVADDLTAAVNGKARWQSAAEFIRFRITGRR